MNMVQSGVKFPSVFVVDGNARPPPLPPKPGRKQRSGICQTLLVILVFVALCGMAVEACFIYHLYTSKEKSPSPSDPQTAMSKQEKEETALPKHKPRGRMNPSKPMAHLTTGRPQNTTKTGIVLWNVSQESILHRIKHKVHEGKLIIEKEGYYSVYSKVHITMQSNYFFHSVLRISPRLPGSEIPLLKSSWVHPKSTKAETKDNSYLGGVFYLLEGDAVFVRVKNCALVYSDSAENYFGLYMV